MVTGGVEKSPLILIVEDNVDIASYLTHILMPAYRVTIVQDALAGLVSAHDQHPDLILCEMTLPTMSCHDFITVIRAQSALRTLPIIILGTPTDSDLHAQLLRAGAQGFLMKPFLPEEFYVSIAHFLMARQEIYALQQELARQNQHIVTLMHDMTVLQYELERANGAMKQMNQLQDDFIAIVSHEFRTALTGIQGFSELLHTEDFSADEVKDFASVIHSDALRLTGMITDLLDLERMKTGKMSLQLEPVDINALLTEITAKMRQVLASSHPIQLDVEPALPLYTGDREKITQIFLNLLTNAVKYSPTGGAIHIRSVLESDTIHISVEDHGVGIAPEHKARLFTPYTRLESNKKRYIKGAGLGLAVVWQVCDIHGGRVWVESVEGQGSTFHVMLPLEPSLVIR